MADLEPFLAMIEGADRSLAMESLIRLFWLVIMVVDQTNREDHADSFGLSDYGSVCTQAHMAAYTATIRKASPFIAEGRLEDHMRWVLMWKFQSSYRLCVYVTRGTL